MVIREMLKRDFDIDVLISTGTGRQADPYVIDECDEEDAAFTQMQCLRGINRGLGYLWKIVEWSPCDDDIEVIRIETVQFSDSEIEIVTRAIYFDTSAVAGTPYVRFPLIVWCGPAEAPMLPYEIGWLHYDRTFDNSTSTSVFDQTIQYSAQGAKASMYVYGRDSGTSKNSELERVVSVMNMSGIVHSWPVINFGPFVLKSFLSSEEITAVGIADVGPYFVKFRLTHFDGPKIREMMKETLQVFAGLVEQFSIADNE